ncbi:hypothetical protein HPB47_016859 [Ixodes persulcatus]|uniref:Uncharacterized protein n=1 Tax=Ixodes persulcatus TaxID=34615 RepID=A0AC60QQS9_IXOPE|nr:hypothetical protein HPB47_016859 [Ixodes persulcatus]
MAFACLTLALVILVLMTDMEGTASRNDTSYCCPDVASQLISAANFTLDPCGDYTKYVCHNMDALSRKKVDSQSLEALHISATIGLFRSPAGKYIAAFHRSCLFTLGQGSDLPEKAMTALVETAGVSKTMSPTDVLRVLIQLSVLHGLHTPIDINVFQIDEGINVFTMSPEVRSTFAGARYDDVGQKVLSAYNEILRVNVSKEDVSKLNSSSPETKRGSVRCNNSFLVLHTLVSGVSQQEWIAMAAPFHIGPTLSITCYSDIDFIGEILHALTSESERREVQLALLLVMCSVDLVLRRYGHQPNTLFSRCESWTNQLTPLWRIIVHEQLTDSHRDRDVRGIFIATKKAVTGDVLEFLHPVDASDAVRLLSTVRLVLPKQLIPDDLPLPEAEPNYYLNALTMKLYRLTVDKRLGAFVKNPYEFHHASLETTIRRLHNDVLLVPSLAYPMFMFGDDVDPAINAVTLGVEMAFEMWSLVFDFGNWSEESASRIREHVACSSVGNSRGSNFHTKARLSIKSASASVRAVGRPWQQPQYVWSHNRLSRAQMFYMKFATQRCAGWRGTKSVNDVLTSLRDFREAYSCFLSASKAVNCSFDY